MRVLHGNLLLLAGLIGIGGVRVGGILSKTAAGPDGNDVEKGDNAAEHSIKRDYVAGYDETGYGHGGYGLGAHSNYGFPEGHEGYGVLEGGKHYVHYPEDHHQHHQHHQEHHKHYDLGYHKALAIKSLLVPLAGVALLGAAAAFVSNPILLQLGVISGSSLGRRKREAALDPRTGDVPQEDRLRDIRLLGRFIGEIPSQKIRSQEKKMVADYLSCSDVSKRSPCLERLACELHSPEGASAMAMEANVLTIVLDEILDNEFVAGDVKTRLGRAVDRGRKNLSCGVFQCEDMDNRKETP